MEKKKGPWTIKTSKVVYQNPWIKVTEDQVIRPDGKDGIFGVVEMKAGSSILPIDDEGNVYLTKEYHYAVENDNLEVISGGIDEGENHLEAAKRELLEEAGITAKEWIELGVLDPFTTVIKSSDYMFIAKGLQFQEQRLEGTEQLEIIKIPYNEALKLVKENKITHGASVVLILRAKEYFVNR
jgi:ADP-ribose pyrophosphatase